MVDKLLPLGDREEALERTREIPLPSSNYGCKLGCCHSDHEFKVRPLHMADAEQLERRISQDWGLVMKTDREGAKVHVPWHRCNDRWWDLS